jgi:hypothetical protein
MFSWKSGICVAGLAAALFANEAATAATPPVNGRAEIRHPGKPSEFVFGTVGEWDDTSVTLRVKGNDRTLKWAELSGVSAYALRSLLIDKKDASAWLKLGTMAWGLNDMRDAKTALTQAAKLDPKLNADIEAIEASSAGLLLEPPGEELMRDVPQEPNDEVVASAVLKSKYHKTSAADAKISLADNREEAKKIAEEQHIVFKEVETEHFLIFTDWSPNSYGFIKQNLEAANACVSKQFDISPSENIFVGKLTVYMFEKHSDFLKFAVSYDHLPPSEGIAGYYASRGTSKAHLAMSKPNFGVGHEQEVNWAYVLTHEFTHAFVARYRSSRHLPTWINEGIAEVVASGQFPREVKSTAARVAAGTSSLTPLFDEHAGMQPGEIYPVMRTLTEVLILKDRKKFLVMFDQMKAGASGAKALKDNYGMTFADLERVWRVYVGQKPQKSLTGP